MKFKGISDWGLRRIALTFTSSKKKALLHTSPEEVIDVKDDSGLFGSFLFFVLGEMEDVQDAYQMSGASKYVHYLDEDELNLADANDIYYTDNYEKLGGIIADITERIGVDEDTAFELLCERISLIELEVHSADDDWWLQCMTAEAAAVLGYDGVEVEDEQGSAYMINMLGRRSVAIGEI